LGIIGLVVAIIPTWILWIQTQKITAQNILLEKQNEKIDYQINLEEATRRSSLVFLMGNIMDKIDEELKDTFNTKNNTRRLSPQLIGRIASLSQSLRPYRYLDYDSLIGPFSPERAQLFLSLLNSELDSVTYAEIYEKATFIDADLSGANLNDLNLSGANLIGANLTNAEFYFTNLSHADLTGANLNGSTLFDSHLKEATLREADLTGADMNLAYFWESNLDDANLTGANLKNATFIGCSFINANLTDADLTDADLVGANFVEAELVGATLGFADLSQAHLVDANLTLADLSQANLSQADLTGANLADVSGLTIDQLSQVSSLFNCKGMPIELEKELREQKPYLFLKPEWMEY
jgi:uncharacterized protein YjbI with pentapeptide repeats